MKRVLIMYLFNKVRRRGMCLCELSCMLMSGFDHILTCHFDSVITADVGLGSARSTNRALSHFLAVTSDALVVNVCLG